jgi:cytochrome c oxidase cbb3-type subunit 3
MAAHNKSEVDALSGVETTGHEWDGLKELNNPLPKWWLQLFYVTIVWAVLYMIAYPAWPLISSYTKGVLGYSSRAAVAEDLAALRARRGEMLAKLETATEEEIIGNPELLSFARAFGRAAFGDNCAPCHGAGGGGARGFPNLVDDDWLWGGTLEAIKTTIAGGIRWNDESARIGNMPAFGRDGLLQKAEIEQVTEFTRTLSGLPAKQGVDLAKGKELFAANCASCHGDDGKGNKDLGAPNLTDAVWLYGSDSASIIEGLTNGRGAAMPAWSGRLDANTIKALTVYVHSLGGGQK